MHVEESPEALIVDTLSEAETDQLGRGLAEVVEPGVVIGLVGPLGAGKTRLARALAEGLGADPAAIGSPTFVLIHEYQARWPIYHFDTYRLRSPGEFEALGAAEYWDAGGICLVEWADRVADLLPETRWMIRAEPTGPAARRFRIEIPGGDRRLAELAARLAAV